MAPAFEGNQAPHNPTDYKEMDTSDEDDCDSDNDNYIDGHNDASDADGAASDRSSAVETGGTADVGGGAAQRSDASDTGSLTDDGSANSGKGDMAVEQTQKTCQSSAEGDCGIDNQSKPEFGPSAQTECKLNQLCHYSLFSGQMKSS